ncbi:hypothetical protein MCANPG14_00030 [Mycoplasmopsis canis PG 14]|uniref:Uncharacterized protein n=1 Tax=Mycoplasmopsis canis TaxID=29555 RepID=A0A449ARQ7_9BACT|nr:hypothetical protein [Mycoplasmopsis canis]AMD81586.1 hypothetical protein AXW82_03465 [Mycoplasmopsis canis PG 14]EIE41069.1 hypothetical protein MCANPG14_00030 [Mycoplasmopsis canis PG 14]VEU69218.1 Uncharacterised protein [Mycoplasmopsis canis]
MKKHKLKLLSGGAILSTAFIGPTFLVSANAENAEHDEVLDKAEKTYWDNKKKLYLSMIEEFSWNDFEGGLNESQKNILKEKVENINKENQNLVWREILKMRFESREAFSKLTTLTFGATHFKELLSKSEFTGLNETMETKFDSLKVFEIAEFMNDSVFKQAYDEFKKSGKMYYEELKNLNTLSTEAYNSILSKALNSYNKFVSVINTSTNNNLQNLKNLANYHKNLINYFYNYQKQTISVVNGDPSSWDRNIFYFGLASNWTLLIGNIKTQNHLENLFFHTENDGEFDAHFKKLSVNSNDFIGPVKEQGESDFSIKPSNLSSEDWFHNGYPPTSPYEAFRRTILDNQTLYNGEPNFTEASVENLDGFIKNLNIINDRFYKNVNGHKYFLENFNFNYNNLPLVFFAWRKGSVYSSASSWTGQYHGRQFNNVSAWKSREISRDKNGFYDSFGNINTTNAYTSNNPLVGDDKNRTRTTLLNGNKRLEENLSQLEGIKNKLQELSTRQPELSIAAEKILNKLDLAKEKNIAVYLEEITTRANNLEEYYNKIQEITNRINALVEGDRNDFFQNDGNELETIKNTIKEGTFNSLIKQSIDEKEKKINEFIKTKENRKNEILNEIENGKVGDGAKSKLEELINDSTSSLNDIEKAYKVFSILNEQSKELLQVVSDYKDIAKPIIDQSKINNENVVTANEILDKYKNKLADNQKIELNFPDNFDIKSSTEDDVQSLKNNFILNDTLKLKEKYFHNSRDSFVVLIENVDLEDEIKNAFKKKILDEEYSEEKYKNEKFHNLFTQLNENPAYYKNLFKNFNSINNLEFDKLKGIPDEVKLDFQETLKQIDKLKENNLLGFNFIEHSLNSNFNEIESLWDKYNNLLNKIESLNKKAYETIFQQGNIGSSALKHFIDYINKKELSFDNIFNVWQVFERLNEIVSRLVKLSERYKNEIEPIVVSSGVYNTNEVNLVNNILRKIHNSKYSFELSKDFNLENMKENENSETTLNINKETQELEKYIKIILNNLVKTLNIPSQIVHEFINISQTESLENLLKIYLNLSGEENSYSELFINLNYNDYELDLSKYPKARTQDILKYKSLLRQLKTLGKDNELAKNILSSILKEELDKNPKDIFNSFKNTKNNVQTRKKSSINKILSILFIVFSILSFGGAAAFIFYIVWKKKANN